MVEINNLTDCRIDKRLFQNIAKRVLKGENKGELIVSLGLVGPREIKRLNWKYRKKNRPTDVLSFLYEDSGEIVLCPKIIRQNAKLFKTSFKKELNRILIHGLLHLAGYDHEGSKAEAERMREKESYYFRYNAKL